MWHIGAESASSPAALLFPSSDRHLGCVFAIRQSHFPRGGSVKTATFFTYVSLLTFAGFLRPGRMGFRASWPIWPLGHSEAIPYTPCDASQLIFPIPFDHYHLQELPQPPEPITNNPGALGVKVSTVKDQTVSGVMISSVRAVVRCYEGFSK